MSPEQVRAQDLDARTDLFSFGVVLYEMATGTTPFHGDSQGLIFDGILNRAPASATQLNPGLPPELARIIDKCLEKDREPSLPARVSEIRADLQRLKRDRDSGRAVAGITMDGRPAFCAPPHALAVGRCRRACRSRRRGCDLQPSSREADRQGHDRARRVHQHDRRSGVRRDAATRTRGTAPAIAVPQPDLR